MQLLCKHLFTNRNVYKYLYYNDLSENKFVVLLFSFNLKQFILTTVIQIFMLYYLII